MFGARCDFTRRDGCLMAKGMDDFKIEYSDQVLTAMNDPKCAEAVRDFMARLRQAMSDVDDDDPHAVAEVLRAFGAVHGDGEKGNFDAGR
jgi:predicted secreted Zn-dependent protease